MTVNGHRSTVHRTAAATQAAAEKRTREAVHRRAAKFRRELHLLDDAWVSALAGVLWAECRMRGLNVPDLLNDEGD